MGDPLPISAKHGIGTGDLLDALVAALPVSTETEAAEAVKIAIVGRPNVGKSSLLNRLLGEERAIVSPIPGTTRDALDTPMTYDGVPVILIDTAGIGRRGHIDRGVEQWSVLRALKAIARADVAPPGGGGEGGGGGGGGGGRAAPAPAPPRRRRGPAGGGRHRAVHRPRRARRR